MYTFFPYSAEQCEAFVPIVYDYFENGTFTQNLPIFPDKFANLFRCPIKVATYNFPPFMMLTERSNDTYIDGIEGVVLRVISQRLNFTTIVVPSSLNILNKYSNATNTTEIKRKYKQSMELVKGNCLILEIPTVSSNWNSQMGFQGRRWNGKCDFGCYNCGCNSSRKVWNDSSIFLWIIVVRHTEW